MNPLAMLDGFKTLIGGLGLIAGGIYCAMNGKDGLAAALIPAGLTAIGLGSKVDKNTEAANRVAVTNAAMDPNAARALQAIADDKTSKALEAAQVAPGRRKG